MIGILSRASLRAENLAGVVCVSVAAPGTVSAPFDAGEHGQVAVKVIDQRGNELLVVKSLKEAEE